MADRYPPRHLLDHKFDEDSRSVLADWHEQHAVPMTDVVNLMHIFPADRSAWPQLPMPPGQWL